MRIWVALVVILASSQHGLAEPLGDSEIGKKLAVQWCASCHIVSEQQESATTEAPPFPSIAMKPTAELEKLDVFLAAPHAPMPPLGLSRTEIRDLIAYITSLKSS
jgi:mono/diheme cytochrome c family protein